MKTFSSIGQLRHVFETVRHWADRQGIAYKDIPPATFKGTVKLHGTNAGIAIDGIGATPVALSRERVLSVTEDNAGFAFFVSTLPQSVIDDIYYEFNPSGAGRLTLFGEWCGKGIQRGVAVNEAPKHFVAFQAYVQNGDDENGGYITFNYDSHFNEHGIYNIGQVPSYAITIDFGGEDQSELEKHLSSLTEQVESECPWSKQIWGVSGVGEGIVWVCAERPFDTGMWFKTKGEKHSVRKSKAKTLIAADPEKVQNIHDCVDIMLTENRMNQMVDVHKLDFTYQNISHFLKAISIDCAKEELDVVVANGLEWKDVVKVLQARARTWFIKKVEAV